MLDPFGLMKKTAGRMLIFLLLLYAVYFTLFVFSSFSWDAKLVAVSVVFLLASVAVRLGGINQ